MERHGRGVRRQPCVFALDKTNGQPRWVYGDGQRAVLNTGIAISSNTVFLIESRVPAVIADADGSVGLRAFMQTGVVLVALHAGTGEKRWEQPFAVPARSMLYLSAIRDMLVASYSYHTGPYAEVFSTDAGAGDAIKALGEPPKTAQEKARSTLIRFGFLACDARTGARRWQREYTSTGVLGAQHNYNVSHPVFTSAAIYHNPAEQYLVTVDLATGALRELKHIRRSKGCATPTASARAMFYRSTGIASFDFATEQQLYVSDVSRPSCWMNVLPAGAVLLMPEYSVGCNCAFPLQTSIVLAPATPPLNHGSATCTP